MKLAAQSAFTLLEIMVALAIIAIAMGAILENTTASTRNAQYLQDKTVAGWIALNEINLMRAKREWNGRTSKQGRVEMAQREWVWKMKILKTPNTHVRKLEIEVFTEDDQEQSLANMMSYMANF